MFVLSRLGFILKGLRSPLQSEFQLSFFGASFVDLPGLADWLGWLSLAGLADWLGWLAGLAGWLGWLAALAGLCDWLNWLRIWPGSRLVAGRGNPPEQVTSTSL